MKNIKPRAAFAKVVYGSGLWRVYSYGAWIITYHGIAERLQHPWLENDFISLATFREQLDYFEKHRVVISLDDLLNCIAEGKTPDRRFVVLCFDDALACLTRYVVPELAARRMPFVIGIPAALPDTGRSLWEYEAAFLVYLLNARGALSKLMGALHDLHESSGSMEKRHRQTDTVAESAAAGHAANALARLKQFLRLGVSSLDRIQMLDKLLAEFVPDFQEQLQYDGRFCVMSWAQLRAAHSAGGSLAAHGFFHHPHNATLAGSCRIEELRRPLETIKSQTDVATDCFIWPEGKSDQASAKLGMSLGYKYFLSTRAGCVSRNTSPDDVPRVSGQWPLPQVLWNAARLR